MGFQDDVKDGLEPRVVPMKFGNVTLVSDVDGVILGFGYGSQLVGVKVGIFR